MNQRSISEISDCIIILSEQVILVQNWQLLMISIPNTNKPKMYLLVTILLMVMCCRLDNAYSLRVLLKKKNSILYFLSKLSRSCACKLRQVFHVILKAITYHLTSYLFCPRLHLEWSFKPEIMCDTIILHSGLLQEWKIWFPKKWKFSYLHIHSHGAFKIRNLWGSLTAFVLAFCYHAKLFEAFSWNTHENVGRCQHFDCPPWVDCTLDTSDPRSRRNFLGSFYSPTILFTQQNQTMWCVRGPSDPWSVVCAQYRTGGQSTLWHTDVWVRALWFLTCFLPVRLSHCVTGPHIARLSENPLLIFQACATKGYGFGLI